MALSNPCIDIIIPTLNCASSLSLCLKSIILQNYSNYKVYIIDGGSTDNTLKVAKKYKCHILNNPLKTGEAGKAIGVRNSHSPLIALIDSDNILPDKNWLKSMVQPLLDNQKIIGSEPWSYSYRSDGGFIERYSALTGVNDPYTLIVGNYDRKNYLYPGWTGLKVKISDKPTYQIATLNPKKLLPTIGANGTILRRSVFNNFSSDYLFDIDVLTTLKRIFLIAKVKVGIIHTFCESSVNKFIRKQFRRATDLYNYRHLRTYQLTQSNFIPTLKFVLYVCLILPMLWHTLIGLIRKPDPAWLFHPLACLITLYSYAVVTIKHHLGILKPINRLQWHQ